MCPPSNQQNNFFMQPPPPNYQQSSAPPQQAFQFQPPQSTYHVPQAQQPSPMGPPQAQNPQFNSLRPIGHMATPSFSQRLFITPIPMGAYQQPPQQMPPQMPPPNYNEATNNGVELDNLGKAVSISSSSSSSDSESDSDSEISDISSSDVKEKVQKTNGANINAVDISSGSDSDSDIEYDAIKGAPAISISSDSSSSSDDDSSSSSSSDDECFNEADIGGGDPHIHLPKGNHQITSSCIAPGMNMALGNVPTFAKPAPRGRGAGRNLHNKNGSGNADFKGPQGGHKSNTRGVGLGNINNNGLLKTLTSTQGDMGNAIGSTFTPELYAKSKRSGHSKDGKNGGSVSKKKKGGQSKKDQKKPLTTAELGTLLQEDENEANAKKKRKKPQVIPFRPLFIISISIVEIFIYVIEIIKTKRVSAVTWGSNPWQWGGIDSDVIIDFGGKYAPYTLRRKEWWRVFTPTFLHVSLVHILFVLLMQLKVGLTLEKSYGSWRIGLIYVLSAIGGNLLSSILMYSQISAGSSGALFGFIGLLFVDLFKFWKKIAKPVLNLISLVLTTVFALFLGFMPGVDNFMHIGGFVIGVIAGIAVLPSPGATPKKKKMALVILLPVLVIIFALLFVLLFVVLGAEDVPEDWCKSCASINCAEALLGESWCRN